MLIRFFMLIVLFAVGMVVAIPVKMVIDTWTDAVDGAGWANFSTLELALIGLFPIVFVLFSVFINPMKRFLQGKNPFSEDDRRLR